MLQASVDVLSSLLGGLLTLLRGPQVPACVNPIISGGLEGRQTLGNFPTWGALPSSLDGDRPALPASPDSGQPVSPSVEGLQVHLHFELALQGVCFLGAHQLLLSSGKSLS